MRATLLLLVVLIGGPAQADEVPDWVVDPSAGYPPERYLVGVGDGETADAAVDDARAALAASFRAEVTAATSMTEHVDETTGGDAARFDRRTEMDSTVEVIATADLPNVVLASTWEDGEGRYLALVVIDRTDAAAVLAADLADRRAEIRRLVGTIGSHRDPVSAYRDARRARALLDESDRISSQYRVVTRGESTPPLDEFRTNVDRWNEDAASHLTVSILRCPDELLVALGQALAGAGLKVVDAGGWLQAELDYRTEEAPGTDRFVFERWSLALRLEKAAEKSVFATSSRSDRAGHQSREAARERCVRDARAALTGSISRELERLLDGDPQDENEDRS